jgi:hypothetical protein
MLRGSEREIERSKSEATKKKNNTTKRDKIISLARDAHLNLKEVPVGPIRHGTMDHAMSCAEKKRDDRRRGAGEKI